ncbi:MAG: hypothetical protein RQ875_03685 [Vicingaceae bacterium]|nr:hypothetical protein [Vicingaceae bacterium]
MKKKYPIIFLIIVSMLLACVKNSYDPIKPSTSSIEPTNEHITYNKTIKPILEQNCIACHHPQTLNVLPFLTNYEEVKFEAESGTLVSTIFDAYPRLMPPSKPLETSEKELITKWINLYYPK